MQRWLWLGLLAGCNPYICDLDGDGYGVLSRSCPNGSVVKQAGDCDNNDIYVNPGRPEICDNGIDDNCDNRIDDETGIAGARPYYEDRDGDGFGDPTSTRWCLADGFVGPGRDCDDTDPLSYPDALELCDGLDNDCDLDIDEGSSGPVQYIDADGDGHGDPTQGTTDCSIEGVPDGDDCDDSDPLVFPGAQEICDVVDNDCDLLIDEGGSPVTYYTDADGDGHGDPETADDSCFALGVPDGDDCDDDDDQRFPGNPEICSGIDEDCDKLVDAADPDLTDGIMVYEDADGDSYGSSLSTAMSCGEPPSGFVFDDTDCDDTSDTISPGAPEVCDAADNDCDLLVDDEDEDVILTSWYTDSDGDGYGTLLADLSCQPIPGSVTSAGDCDDDDNTVSPGSPESWYDGTDSDCDGQNDPSMCALLPPPSAGVFDDQCAIAPIGTITPVVEWSMTTFTTDPTYDDMVGQIAVGQLTDDDGDGDIDLEDMPDLVVPMRSGTSSNGSLRILSGDGSGEHGYLHGLTYGGLTYYPHSFGSPALGDIDNDGEPEIITMCYRNPYTYPCAFEADLTPIWVSGESFANRMHSPSIVDIDGDGDIEFVVGRELYDAETGVLVAAGSAEYGYESGYTYGGVKSFPMDIDADGDMEIIAGSTVYSATLATICDGSGGDGYPSAADLDGDGLGEIVVVHDGDADIYEHDCTLTHSFALVGSGWGGPATLADLDGDGAPEIGIADATTYTVYEADGTVLWSMPIDDASSSSTGSSTFDLDGDGIYEILYADEETMWIFDGPTGTVLYSNTDHGSGTTNEYPVVADVDNDGHAEIVFGSDGVFDSTSKGIRVIGASDNSWVAARQIWPAHAWYGSLIEDDLSVPTYAPPPWESGLNAFRAGGNLGPGRPPVAAPDFVLTLAEICPADCSSDVSVAFTVANLGAVAQSADVSLYGASNTGARTLLETLSSGLLLPGDVSAGLTFDLGDPSVLIGYESLVIVADGPAARAECDEDNEIVLSLSACP